MPNYKNHDFLDITVKVVHKLFTFVTKASEKPVNRGQFFMLDCFFLGEYCPRTLKTTRSRVAERPLLFCLNRWLTLNQ